MGASMTRGSLTIVGTGSVGHLPIEARGWLGTADKVLYYCVGDFRPFSDRSGANSSIKSFVINIT